jgi:hypothetical protein
MKYRIGDIVEDLISGKICQIVGNKEQPYYNSAIPFNKTTHVTDGHDYVLIVFQSKDEEGINWSGLLQAKEEYLKPAKIE